MKKKRINLFGNSFDLEFLSSAGPNWSISFRPPICLWTKKKSFDRVTIFDLSTRRIPWRQGISFNYEMSAATLIHVPGKSRLAHKF